MNWFSKMMALVLLLLLFSGCGKTSGSQTAVAPPMTVNQESPQEQIECPESTPAVENAETPSDEIPITEIPVSSADEVQTDKTVSVSPVKARNRIVFRSTYYYDYQLDPVPLEPQPRDIEGVIGYIDASEDPTLVGCAVHSIPYTTEFTRHAVNGQSVPQTIFVESPDGYRLYSTANEKTVSRYTYADVQTHVDSHDDYWLLDTFVLRLEQHCPELDFTESDSLTEDMLNQILMATSDMNCGVNVKDYWYSDDMTQLIIPLSDVFWRLDRFLEAYTYTPEETARYDSQQEAILFDCEETYIPYNTIPVLTLQNTSFLDNKTVLFTIENHNTGTVREYTIRFDEDSWRYLSIISCEA